LFADEKKRRSGILFYKKGCKSKKGVKREGKALAAARLEKIRGTVPKKKRSLNLSREDNVSLHRTMPLQEISLGEFLGRKRGGVLADSSDRVLRRGFVHGGRVALEHQGLKDPGGGKVTGRKREKQSIFQYGSRADERYLSCLKSQYEKGPWQRKVSPARG